MDARRRDARRVAPHGGHPHGDAGDAVLSGAVSEAKQADQIGIVAARIAEASADRLLIRLGAWTLAVVTLAVSLATAVILAAMGAMLP